MADIYRNPYDFVNPIKDSKLFAGREQERKEIDYYLELSRSSSPKCTHMAFIGDRASGKTSLLNIAKLMAEEKNFLAVKISLNKETSSNDVLFFKEVFDSIMTKGAEKGMYGGLTDKIYKSFRKIIDTLDISGEVPLLFGTVYVGMKKEKHDTGIPQHVLIHDLKEFSKEAREKKIPTIVLLFDECDLLAQSETLLQKIRNVFMEVEGYILVFSGTEAMFPAISSVFSPIPRFFKRVNVENFKNIKETQDCLLKPLSESERVVFDQFCVGEVHQLTNGSPYEINLIAHYMYRIWKEGKNSKIGLTSDVMDGVLNEIERFRKGKHHEIADRIRQYWPDQLEILVSLLEFPDVPREWLAEYMLLDEIETIQPKDVYLKKSSTLEYVEQLRKDGTIMDENGKIRFSEDQFDTLYLKYICASKGILNTKEFFVGFSNDPIMNLRYKLLQSVILKDFKEYGTRTNFDRRVQIDGKMMKRWVASFKIPPGKHTIPIFSQETEEEFYKGTTNSTRFRINVEWMKEGFVTQIKFKSEEDKKRFQDRMNALRDKLDFLGYKILDKDEISWNTEGAELSKQGKLSEAMEYYDKAIEINPAFELPWLNKASVSFVQKKYDDALEFVNKTLELDRSSSEALKLKGMILINLRRNEEALECLEKVIRIDPENYEAWDNKGRVLVNMERFEEALLSFDKVLKANPDNIEALNIRALAQFRIGKLEEAMRDLNKVLEKDLESISALNVKSLVFQAMSKYEEASKCCDKILEIDPNNAAAMFNKACFKSDMGETDNAIQWLERAIKIDKKYIEFARNEKNFASIRNDERFVKLIS